MTAVAHALLDASTLCAIATVGSGGTAHVNTAYFARGERFELFWLSDPAATHSKNLRRCPTAAVAVYDSHQAWGERDRGIQLFGSARVLAGAHLQDAEMAYGKRFRGFRPDELAGYCIYSLEPERLKLFDERELGSGRFVIARLDGDGRLVWEATEISHGGLDTNMRSYHPGSSAKPL